MLVQAVVMVTTISIGNGHLWTIRNLKLTNRLSAKFAQVVRLVGIIYVQNVVTISFLRTFRHMFEIISLMSLLNTLSVFPSLIFFSTSTGRTPEPILMVDCSDDAI